MASGTSVAVTTLKSPRLGRWEREGEDAVKAGMEVKAQVHHLLMWRPFFTSPSPG